MSIPFSGPVTGNGSCCEVSPGRQPPDLAPYVRSINGLQGIVFISGDEFIDVGATGNTITLNFNPTALVPIFLADEEGYGISLEGGITYGTGTVRSVELGSSTLVITGTNPITSSGTVLVNLTGATASIQALTTAANKMIYTTASNVYAVTDLTAFARTILDDSDAATVLSTIGAQPLNADLTSLITHTSWSGANVTFSGNITGSNLTGGNGTFSNAVGIAGSLTGTDATFSSNVDASAFNGAGSGLTALNGSNISSGTVAVARGGTGTASYAVGDILYASASTTLSKLADVSVGSFLRSGGVATAPAWSTLKLPNSATAGDLLYASSANTMANLADVATGNALISGGVGTAPSWGKVTASHTTGLAASGVNSDITQLNNIVSVQSALAFGYPVTLEAAVYDKDAYEGQSGALLTSTVTGVQWLRSVNVDSIRIDQSLSTEGTLTTAGTTGNRTINKMSGSVNFAAAATSITVTNSLVGVNSRVLAMISTNDTTAYVKNVVVSAGSFVITLGAAATAEAECSWIVFTVT